MTADISLIMFLEIVLMVVTVTALTVLVTYNYDFLVLTNLGFGQQVLTAQTLMKTE